MEPNMVDEQMSRYASLESRVGERNLVGILDAEIATVQLDGTDADSGASSEATLMYTLGKPVFGWRSDWRNTGELRGRAALQTAFFIEDSQGFIHHGCFEEYIEKLDEALDTIRPHSPDLTVPLIGAPGSRLRALTEARQK